MASVLSMGNLWARTGSRWRSLAPIHMFFSSTQKPGSPYIYHIPVVTLKLNATGVTGFRFSILSSLLMTIHHNLCKNITTNLYKLRYKLRSHHIRQTGSFRFLLFPKHRNLIRERNVTQKKEVMRMLISWLSFSYNENNARRTSARNGILKKWRNC